MASTYTRNKGTSKNLLRDQSAAKRGARNLAYLLDMSRFLCSVRLASWPLITIFRGAHNFVTALCLSIICCTGIDYDQEKTTGADRYLIGGSDADQGQFPATLRLGGCTAAKIGPRQYLTAAHCEMRRIPDFVDHETTAGSGSKLITPPKFPKLQATDEKPADRPVVQPPLFITDDSGEQHELSFEKLFIHPSYEGACRNTCPNDISIGAGVADVAVVVAIETTPTIEIAQIDYRTPQLYDRVIIQGYGCEDDLQSQTGRGVLKYEETEINEVGASYFHTPGRQQDGTIVADEASLCPGDSGGPVYSLPTMAIIGVNAYYTFDPGSAISRTNMHTLLSDDSDHQVGSWLRCILEEDLEQCPPTDISPGSPTATSPDDDTPLDKPGGKDQPTKVQDEGETSTSKDEQTSSGSSSSKSAGDKVETTTTKIDQQGDTTDNADQQKHGSLEPVSQLPATFELSNAADDGL